MLKRDNIQIFANATVKFGVPRSARMSYTFFDNKDVDHFHFHKSQNASIITSLLVFVRVLLEKKTYESVHLPESFLHSSSISFSFSFCQFVVNTWSSGLFMVRKTEANSLTSVFPKVVLHLVLRQHPIFLLLLLSSPIPLPMEISQ